MKFSASEMVNASKGRFSSSRHRLLPFNGMAAFNSHEYKLKLLALPKSENSVT